MPTHLADDVSPDTATATHESNAVTQADAVKTPECERIRMTTLLVYHLSNIVKTEAPDGAQGKDWYRYELKNHNSTIHGYRRGSRQCVSAYATQYAEQLNTRTVLGPSPWSQRGNKVAPRTR